MHFRAIQHIICACGVFSFHKNSFQPVTKFDDVSTVSTPCFISSRKRVHKKGKQCFSGHLKEWMSSTCSASFEELWVLNIDIRNASLSTYLKQSLMETKMKGFDPRDQSGLVFNSHRAIEEWKSRNIYNSNWAYIRIISGEISHNKRLNQSKGPMENKES